MKALSIKTLFAAGALALGLAAAPAAQGGVCRYTAWRNGKRYRMAVDAGGVTRLRRIHD